MFYNFPTLKTRTYISLQEVCQARDNEHYYGSWKNIPDKGAFEILCGVEGKDTPITTTLLKDYIWPEYWNSTICYVDQDGIIDDTIPGHLVIKVADSVLGHIYRWLNESTERYSILIENLNQIKSKLMAQVQSTTTSDNDVLALFNDTPQAGGDFTGDDYVTNASKNTSSSSTTIATDAATPIARLKEVQDKLDSLYGRWADEFSRFVLH